MTRKTETLRALHVKGAPLVLFNMWDAGSARAVAASGAAALATGSWSVAEAQGYLDGQNLPLDDVLAIARRIVDAVDVPVSVDFEGGYAVEPEAISANVAQLALTGAAGLNFEDQLIGGAGLHSLAEQAVRVAAVRAADVDIVINARTDLFLKEPDSAKHGVLVAQALERGAAYAESGADCFFVPGLSDIELIAKVCAGSHLPVNVMHTGQATGIKALADAGVGRISHGPIPYRRFVAWLEEQAQAVLHH